MPPASLPFVFTLTAGLENANKEILVTLILPQVDFVRLPLIHNCCFVFISFLANLHFSFPNKKICINSSVSVQRIHFEKIYFRTKGNLSTEFHLTLHKLLAKY